MPDRSRSDVAAAERWFVDHGLPYFVDDYRAAVARGLAGPGWCRCSPWPSSWARWPGR